MSIEMILGITAGVIALIAVGFGVALRVVDVHAAERTDDLARWTEKELIAVRARLNGLEAELRELAPAIAAAREGCSGKADPRKQISHLQHSTAPTPPPEPTLEEIYEDAARALGSASAFNAFAERFRGRGYVLDVGGPSPLPSSSPSDRADIYVLTAPNIRLVLPGFNLRRGQGLLTSDAGRAAVERLGWLFDIVPGSELRAIAGAFVEPDSWTVRHKGRLSVPL